LCQLGMLCPPSVEFYVQSRTESSWRQKNKHPKPDHNKIKPQKNIPRISDSEKTLVAIIIIVPIFVADPPMSSSAMFFETACSTVISAASECNVTRLEPKAYFVAWNGVLCLMFTGFPPSLTHLKNLLNDGSNNNAWKKEGFGSKWPKVTLGFLKDGQMLSLQEFEVLQSLCKRLSKKFSDLCSEDTPNNDHETSISIQNISVVEYEQRGLERYRLRTDIALKDSSHDNNKNEIPSMEELQRTDSVYSEWNDTHAYLEKVNIPGEPYRNGSKVGYTCVAFLDLDTWVTNEMETLRQQIDEALPGKYEWLQNKSLHCTIRSLNPAIAP
jgi:hypothetical protein